MDNNLHGTDDQLEQYALGRMPASDLAVLEEHFIICGTCQTRLSLIEDFVEGMREALRTAPEVDRAAMPHTDWFGWLRWPSSQIALGFAAIILVVVTVSISRTPLAPGASLQLTAMRGEMPFTNPAREFDLTLSDAPREGGPFRVDVVNATGASIWAGTAESGPSGVKVKLVQQLKPGDYFVRLYSTRGETGSNKRGKDTMLHEYGFRIRG